MDRVALRVETWDGRMTGCSTVSSSAIEPPTTTEVLELSGAIVGAQGNAVSIDSCDANLGCEPQISTLYVDAPGIDLTGLPTGTAVALSHRWSVFWGCTETVLMVGPEARVYLAASEGSVELFGAPFTVEAVPLGCPSEGSGCGVPPDPDTVDDYLLRFIVADETHDVFMGQTEEMTWTSGSTPETWRVRNLRSFETGHCDDYWNWAYWTVRVAAP